MWWSLSVGLNHVCQIVCIFLLSMLWILTVHKKNMKTILFLDAFPSTLKKREKHKRVVTVCQDSYPKCSWVLTGFSLQFTKGLTQFVVFDWLQSCSSVGLHCASLLAHSLPQSEAPPSVFISFSLCFTSSHIVSTATGWSVYNHNISTTVKRDWTWGAFKVQNSTKRHKGSQQISSKSKAPWYSSVWIPLSFSLFPNGLYSKWGSRCFHTAVQGCQYCNTAAEKPQLIGWS